MKEQDIAEIVSAADQAMTNAIKTQFAETFERMYKRNRFNVNTSLIVVVAAIALAGFWVNAKFNAVVYNSDNNAAVLLTKATEIADAQAGMYDSIDEAVTQITDTVNNATTENTKQIDAMKEQLNKQEETLDNLLAKANSTKIVKYQNCLMAHTGTIEAAAKACKKHLK